MSSSVVVTGIGLVSPGGIGIQETLRTLESHGVQPALDRHSEANPSLPPSTPCLKRSMRRHTLHAGKTLN